MGNGCHHKRRLHRQESFQYNKSTFLPLLCRLSIRDVNRDRSTSTSLSTSEDPTSPQVSCMGQVKKNQQLFGFSTPYRLTATAASSTSTAAIISQPDANRGGHFKYTKLRRLFSGKNLPTTTATVAAAAPAPGDARSRSCREIVVRRNGSRRSSKINNDDGGDHRSHSCRLADDNHVDLDINELDPPLPVTREIPRPSEISLWKRRSGGVALGNLQIEQIQVPHKNMDNYVSVTTV